MQAARGQRSGSAIEQSRLFQNTPTATNQAVNADGTALAEDDSDSSDDSFGTQVILKPRERIRTFFFSADASDFYTSNAALTPDDTIDDGFLVANAAFSWNPRISPRLEGQLSIRSSIFRYHSNSALNFVNLGLGGGLFWSPENFGGVSLFARYDLVELFDRHSEEILRDHTLTLGGQRTFALGRNQALILGATVMGGVSDPSSAQRQQAGIFLGYHVQITRALDTELFYKVAYHNYNVAGRNDFNQILSWNLRYRLWQCADLSAFLSFGSNRSDQSAFDYDVLTAGSGVGLIVRF